MNTINLHYEYGWVTWAYGEVSHTIERMAKETLYNYGTLLVETVFEYDTPKYVHIKNKKIGVIYRLVQLAILAYVIGWADKGEAIVGGVFVAYTIVHSCLPLTSYGIVYQHQAQKSEPVQSVVTTKLKGVDVVNNPGSFMDNCPSRPPNQDWVVFDHTDLVVPPQVGGLSMWMSVNIHKHLGAWCSVERGGCSSPYRIWLVLSCHLEVILPYNQSLF